MQIIGLVIMAMGGAWLAAPYLNYSFVLVSGIGSNTPLVGVLIVLIGLSIVMTAGRTAPEYKKRRGGKDSF